MINRIPHRLILVVLTLVAGSVRAAPELPGTQEFIENYCADCHDDIEKEANLDLASFAFKPEDRGNFLVWMKAFERVEAGEMPPKKKKRRPEAGELAAFLQTVGTALTAHESAVAAEGGGRATQRRLNGYEYENSLRDLFSAPWLQIRGQFPEDGEAHRFNKVAEGLNISHVHMARYLAAADYAIRQVLSVKLTQPETKVERHYARDQRSLVTRFTPDIFNSSPDRLTYPVVGLATPQPEVRARTAPLTVGAADPELRDQEAVGWVSSNYVTGFTYRWDRFRAPVAGRYRIRFSGYTLWVSPGGIQQRFENERDKVGQPRPPNPMLGDYDALHPGRTHEPVTVYTRNGMMNRRVGEFDLTPEPAVYDIGEVWLLANETLVPDASRFYRSRPENFRNPLMTPEGAPSVAFRWMEVEGPLYDEVSTAGYRLLFDDLPLRRVADGQSGGIPVPVVRNVDDRDRTRRGSQRIPPLVDVAVEVVSERPRQDARRLIDAFLQRAYRRPVTKKDSAPFFALFDERMGSGLSFTEALIAAYTAVLASPGYIFLNEKAGELDDHALATRLALFLWNSEPDAALRARADRGELRRPEVLRGETERLLNDRKSRRFVDAFLAYWVDLRKMEDTTPSTTLYNDYYLDDSLTEAALEETQLFFDALIRDDLPARNLIDSDSTYLNERLALHYGISDVKGSSMRRVTLPAGSPRGGLMTQASVLKVTANGTTTSPVLRGRWIVERIMGIEIPPPPPVAAVEPDIRGAVTIRQQLDQHRADASCASCHQKMDPPGFALESFDVLGGWRDRYRGISPDQPPEKGLGKNGHAFEWYYGLPVDASGELPDGRAFADIHEFKRLLLESERDVARNLAKQLVIYGTGAPVRFSDRAAIEEILRGAQASDYGVRALVHGVIQSDLFRQK